MGKKQLELDFEELYTGQNSKLLIQKYYKKKHRDLILIFIGFAAVICLLVINSIQNGKLPEGNVLTRNEYGDGKKEVELEVRTKEGTWQDFSFVLEEKEYTEEELELYFEEIINQLPDLIIGENESLGAVVSDLQLISEVEGYPFSLFWESSEPEWIDEEGHILDQHTAESGKVVEFGVTVEYEDWAREHRFSVYLSPQTKDQETLFLQSLTKLINEKETSYRQDREFQLPEVHSNETLQWRYKGDAAVLGLALIFLILLPLISIEKDREIHKMAIKRRENLLDQYPEFISKIVLFMEAGMNVKGALFRIAEDYQRKRMNGRKQEHLYEEILYVCRQMKNGLPEAESYELLGKRCGLSVYKKLSALFVQHLQKGTKEILDMLRSESTRANEERKNRVKRKGEEAGTKLLFPMMIMLGIVMILIIVPACFSFQI